MKPFVCFLSLLALAACNTLQGVGKDLRNAGEALEQAATETKQRKTPKYTKNPGDTQKAYPVQTLEHRELETIPYEKY